MTAPTKLRYYATSLAFSSFCLEPAMALQFSNYQISSFYVTKSLNYKNKNYTLIAEEKEDLTKQEEDTSTDESTAAERNPVAKKDSIIERNPVAEDFPNNRSPIKDNSEEDKKNPIAENNPVFNKNPVAENNKAINGNSKTEDEPVVTDPVVEDKPVVTDPLDEDKPVVTEPVVEDKPVVTEPVVKDKPVVTEPVVKDEPVVTVPVVEEKPNRKDNDAIIEATVPIVTLVPTGEVKTLTASFVGVVEVSEIFSKLNIGVEVGYADNFGDPDKATLATTKIDSNTDISLIKLVLTNGSESITVTPDIIFLDGSDLYFFFYEENLVGDGEKLEILLPEATPQ
jgi:hypothetical protein